MKESIVCNNYEIPLYFLDEIEKYRSILLHAPDGLKHLYSCIGEILTSRGFKVYYSTNPGYGACDIPFEEALMLKVDVIIHLGHEKYVLADQSIEPVKTLYIPVYYKRLLEESLLVELYKVLKEHKAGSVTLSSTLVEYYVKKSITSFLVEKGITVHEVEKPILGCYYAPILSLEEDVDAHVIVSGGLFHPLGLGLISSKPIVVVDPYSSKIWIANRESEKILRQRYYLLLKVKESTGSSVGLIIGTRPGQHRPTLINIIEKLASTSGFKVHRIASNYLTIDRLYAIDNALNLDFYIVTSCPRLPIDDLREFHKPILTPGEFIMLVKNIEKYTYPW